MARAWTIGGLAQMVERLVRNEKAKGSIPLSSKGNLFFCKLLLLSAVESVVFLRVVSVRVCLTARVAVPHMARTNLHSCLGGSSVLCETRSQHHSGVLTLPPSVRSLLLLHSRPASVAVSLHMLVVTAVTRGRLVDSSRPSCCSVSELQTSPHRAGSNSNSRLRRSMTMPRHAMSETDLQPAPVDSSLLHVTRGGTHGCRRIGHAPPSLQVDGRWLKTAAGEADAVSCMAAGRSSVELSLTVRNHRSHHH